MTMPPLQHSQAVCGHEPSTLACSLIAVDVVHVAAEKTIQDAVYATAEHSC